MHHLCHGLADGAAEAEPALEKRLEQLARAVEYKATRRQQLSAGVQREGMGTVKVWQAKAWEAGCHSWVRAAYIALNIMTCQESNQQPTMTSSNRAAVSGGGCSSTRSCVTCRLRLMDRRLDTMAWVVAESSPVEICVLGQAEGEV